MRIESDHGELQSLSHFIYGMHPLIRWLEDHQIEYKTHLKLAGIPEDALAQPEYTITPTQEISFIRSIYQQINQPELGLIMGPRYHLSSYGMLGLAAMTSSDLFNCYKVVLANIVLTWTYFTVSVYVEQDLAYVQMDPIRNLGGSAQFMIDRDLSAAYLIAKEALEKELPLVQVEFQHPATGYQDEYTKVFNCPVKFNAKYNRFSFDKSWLEHPLAKAEPATSRIFAAQCEQISAAMYKMYSFIEHIRYHLLNSSSESPSLEALAKTMNTTPRTIQRKLAAENSSFQELLNDTRVTVAMEYLSTTTLTIEEIAEHMSYSDAAAFSNAFKRWTGASPTSYRKNLN